MMRDQGPWNPGQHQNVRSSGDLCQEKVQKASSHHVSDCDQRDLEAETEQPPSPLTRRQDVVPQDVLRLMTFKEKRQTCSFARWCGETKRGKSGF